MQTYLIFVRTEQNANDDRHIDLDWSVLFRFQLIN